MQKYKLAALLLLTCCLSIAIISYRQQLAKTRQRYAHVLAENLNQMIQLEKQLSDVAVFSPDVFYQTVGTGIVVKATSLPRAIRGEFPDGATNYFVDTFGNPYNIALIRKTNSTDPKNVIFSLSVWSCGENGLNEKGKGDDIASKETTLECPQIK